MAEIITCPEPGRLQDLLDGNLSDEQQTELNSHLESCRSCQQRLESLAAGKETWTEAARILNVGSAAPEAGLQRVMAESKQEGHCEPERPAAEAPLDFLTPSDDPAHLGRLGPYEVIELISRGGMSIVLKAFDPSLHRVIAIKVLAPQLATSAAARTRFRREGFAAAAISHEHVVAVYAVDDANTLPYLVMEYISGESLQERLDRDGPLELKEVLRIGMQTAQGLAAAHAQGLVHRDIKPANILLHNGVARVKITDFGLARAVDDATLTQSGFVAGTPQYMSPEQARGDAIDHRTDLFSLGSVLYAMCTGRPPFRASTTMGVLKRVSDESARAVREVNPEVPPWLAEIIGKLHAKIPAERYQSAAEVAELLGKYLAQLQQGLPMPTVAMPASRAEPAPRRSGIFHKRPWAIAAALLPIIAGALVVSEATGVTNVTELVATVLRIRTPEGTLVIETDDPNVEVIVDNGDIRIHGAGPKEIQVKAGQHRIRATRDGKEVLVDQELITVTRGGRQIVRVRHENDKSIPAGRTAPPVYGLPGLLHVATLNSRTWLIRSVIFSPDGNNLVSAGNDGAPKAGGIIELWALKSKAMPEGANKALWLWKNPAPIQAAAFSPGGTTLATGDLEGTVRFRNADRGDLIKILHAGTGPVNAVAFAPDGQMLAAGNSDGKVRIIRVATREILERFESGNSQGVLCLAYSPDGKMLAVGGSDRPRLVPQFEDVDGNLSKDQNAALSAVRLFEVGSWKTRAFLAGHIRGTRALAFAPDGKLLATAGADGIIKLWNVADGKEVARFKGHAGPVNVLTFSPDGTLLISGGEDKTVKLWDVVRRKLFLSSAQDGAVQSLALSPDGKTLAVGGTFEIKLWNLSSVYAQSAQRQHLATLKQKAARAEILYKQGAIEFATVQKARLAALAAELELSETPQGRIVILERILAERREIEKRFETLYKAGAVAESALLDARAKREEAEIDLQREKARAPAANVPVPKGPAAGGSETRSFPNKSRELATLQGYKWVIWSLVFAPDGKRVFSAGGGPGKATTEPVSGELKAWEITALLDPARHHPRPPEAPQLWSAAAPSIISAVAISPGGMTLATAEADGTVRLRDADNGWLEAMLRGHKGPVYTVAFAPDGQTLASGGLDCSIKIWHVGTQKLLESFDSGSTRMVKCLAFSKDGKTLAVGGEDMHLPGGPYLADPNGNIINKKRYTHLLRLFDVGSWKARVSIRHDAPVDCLAFSPDGKLLATASYDQVITLWNVANGKQVAAMQHPSHKGRVRCLAFSPDGSLLAAGGDQPVTLWSVARRKAVLVLDKQRNMYSLAFSPDGKILAFAGKDRIVKLWDITAAYRPAGTDPAILGFWLGLFR